MAAPDDSFAMRIPSGRRRQRHRATPAHTRGGLSGQQRMHARHDAAVCEPLQVGLGDGETVGVRLERGDADVEAEEVRDKERHDAGASADDENG